jgi:hypothetical protein
MTGLIRETHVSIRASFIHSFTSRLSRRIIDGRISSTTSDGRGAFPRYSRFGMLLSRLIPARSSMKNGSGMEPLPSDGTSVTNPWPCASRVSVCHDQRGGDPAAWPLSACRGVARVDEAVEAGRRVALRRADCASFLDVVEEKSEPSSPSPVHEVVAEAGSCA